MSMYRVLQILKLSYNSNIIKFTFFKVYNWVDFNIFREYINITTVYFQNIFIFLKETLYPLRVEIPAPKPASHLGPLSASWLRFLLSTVGSFSVFHSLRLLSLSPSLFISLSFSVAFIFIQNGRKWVGSLFIFPSWPRCSICPFICNRGNFIYGCMIIWLTSVSPIRLKALLGQTLCLLLLTMCSTTRHNSGNFSWLNEYINFIITYVMMSFSIPHHCHS